MVVYRRIGSGRVPLCRRDGSNPRLFVYACTFFFFVYYYVYILFPGYPSFPPPPRKSSTSGGVVSFLPPDPGVYCLPCVCRRARRRRVLLAPRGWLLQTGTGQPKNVGLRVCCMVMYLPVALYTYIHECVYLYTYVHARVYI